MSLPYSLIRSRRRTLSLSIGKDGELIARAPRLMPVYFIEDFIRAKSSWIEKQQSRHREIAENKKENSGFYFLFGERYPRGSVSEKEITAIERSTLRDYVSSRIDTLT